MTQHSRQSGFSYLGFLRSLWTPDLRLALLLCIPGVVVALGLRLWLTYHMPYGFVHGDTAQQVVTGLKLVERGYLRDRSEEDLSNAAPIFAPGAG